jgi:hypothetical protein
MNVERQTIHNRQNAQPVEICQAGATLLHPVETLAGGVETT